VAGCILHTDRGSQFRSRKLVHALNQHSMVGSMGRVGATGDNAAMESFFALLQKNVRAATDASTVFIYRCKEANLYHQSSRMDGAS
jgi:transposase InsO family protein